MVKRIVLSLLALWSFLERRGALGWTFGLVVLWLWACHRRVVPLLWLAGHRVVPVTLSGLGERAHQLSPDITLDTHVQDVVTAMRAEECSGPCPS